MSDTTKNAIEVKNLCKKYKDFQLNNVSFNVEGGTIMGFVGQNGAGKTTTIKSILNIVNRDAGEIKVFGLDNIKNEVEIKENVGVMFDDICFHQQLNMCNINSIMKLIFKRWNEKQFFEYADRFELPKKKSFKAYSRGMKMKASLAVALSHDAKLLILDEPTSGLDPMVRSDILDIMQDFIVSEEHTILFSSHITSDLERIADNITFIHKGGVILSENKLDLLERHAILKCGEKEYAELDKSGVIAMRKSSFGCEVMVNDAELYRRSYPQLVADRPTIEDIMVYYSREGK